MRALIVVLAKIVRTTKNPREIYRALEEVAEALGFTLKPYDGGSKERQ